MSFTRPKDRVLVTKSQIGVVRSGIVMSFDSCTLGRRQMSPLDDIFS